MCVIELLLHPPPGQLRPGQRQPAADSAAGVRRGPVPERHQVGSPELGGQRPEAALQEGLPAPPTRRHVHPGAAALGVLRQEEEADCKQPRGRSQLEVNCEFCR